MRVVSLHLDRYGRFTDCRLEFPRNADLCLVYGLNEAGKSTALSGLCDFLFGFPHNAAYDFLHEFLDFENAKRLIVYGLVLIVMMIVRPDGILTRDSLRRFSWSRKASSQGKPRHV